MLAIVALTVMTIATGVVFRVADARPSVAAMESIASRLDGFPDAIDGWRQSSAPEVSADVLRELQCQGTVNRLYRQPTNGRSAHVTMLLGPAGPIATHTPEVCYSTTGYEIIGEQSRVTIETVDHKTHQFWVTQVRRRDATGDFIRVYHAWNANGTWAAPDNARLAFTFSPYLYKCQIAFSEFDSRDSAAEEEAFVRGLIESAQSCCVPTAF
jgi:hypothetical protein